MRIDIQNVEGRIVYKKVILGDHPKLLHRIMKIVEKYEELLKAIEVKIDD